MPICTHALKYICIIFSVPLRKKENKKIYNKMVVTMFTFQIRRAASSSVSTSCHVLNAQNCYGTQTFSIDIVDDHLNYLNHKYHIYMSMYTEIFF